MDTNSFSFASFSNQAPGYCTPATGGTSTYYHNKAGDLHTPNIGFHLGTPLSLPHSEGRHDVAAFDMHGFQPNFLESHGLSTADHFGPQPTFAPSSFLQQASTFEALDESTIDTPTQQTVAGNAVNQQATIQAHPSKTAAHTLPEMTLISSNKSVYHVLYLMPSTDMTYLGFGIR